MVADILDRFNIVAKRICFLADEPTGNLHSEQSEQIMEMFKKLNDKGVTIIQVTHSGKMVAYGNPAIHLRDGVLAGEDPYEEETVG